MRAWLIACVVLMAIGIISAIVGALSGMGAGSKAPSAGPMAFGAIVFVIGFFGGVIVILALA